MSKQLKPTSATLDQTMIDRLDALAERMCVSRAAVIRILLVQALARQEPSSEVVTANAA